VVDVAGGAGQAGLERPVHRPDRLEVRLERHRGVEGEVRFARGVFQRREQGRHRDLARGAGHGGHRHVYGVHAGVDRRHEGGELPAGGVVGVQVDRQVEALPQGAHEDRGGPGPQQAGHVLDRQHVRTGRDDLLREVQVVVEGVERLARIGEVRGVAECHLGHGGPGLAHRGDRGGHLPDVVEGVEDPEDVDTGGRGLLHERVRHLGGVGGVAHGVAAAQQHLERDVGQLGAQQFEAAPRVLGEEPQCHVVGGAAPDLHREQPGKRVGERGCGGEEVPGPHPGGEQGLVRVAERGVGDLDRRGLPQRPRERLRAVGPQPVAPAGRHRGR